MRVFSAELRGVALARIDDHLRDRAIALRDQFHRRELESTEHHRFADAPFALLLREPAGAGGFTKEQREWSIGEAMVLSGFQFTPVELIAKGDRAIAQMIVDARKGDAA